MVQEGGLDTLSGSRECDADSEGLYEELDLASFSPRLRAIFERQSEEEIRLSREKRAELEDLLTPGNVIFDRDMSVEVSMAASGIAEALVSVCDTAALKDVIRWAVENDVEYSFIGSCSKTIVRESGVSGLLIRLAEQFDSVELVSESENEVLILAGAATSVRKLIGFCVEKGFSGLEDLLLYEGTVGGCVSSDVSLSNGDKISKSVVETTIINKEQRELTIKNKQADSDLRVKIPSTSCITKVLFKMSKGDIAEIAKRVDEIEKRHAEVASGSTGYIFHVFEDQGRMLARELVEDSGLRGVRIGKARVSPIDANSIINEGGATAKDVRVIMNLIRDRVRQDSGIALATRIRLFGKVE